LSQQKEDKKTEKNKRKQEKAKERQEQEQEQERQQKKKEKKSEKRKKMKEKQQRKEEEEWGKMRVSALVDTRIPLLALIAASSPGWGYSNRPAVFPAIDEEFFASDEELSVSHEDPPIPHKEPSILDKEPFIRHKEPSITHEEPTIPHEEPSVPPQEPPPREFSPQVSERHKPEPLVIDTSAPEASTPKTHPQEPSVANTSAPGPGSRFELRAPRTPFFWRRRAWDTGYARLLHQVLRYHSLLNPSEASHTEMNIRRLLRQFSGDYTVILRRV
jgi:hypothetical protein